MPTRLLLPALLLLLLATGCAPPAALPAPPTMPPTTVPATPAPAPTEAIAGQANPSADLQAAGASAVQVAAADLGLDPDAITVTAIEEMEWSDASLGCPQPGYVYAQVITPGYLVTVEAGGQSYDVHMDSQGYGLVCPPP